MAVAATAAVHVAILALLLWGTPRPPTDEPQQPTLTLFDLPRPPEPPPVPVSPPPVTPEPVVRESAIVRATAGGGSPRPMRAPVAAAQAAPTAGINTARFDMVNRPAPEMEADLPIQASAAASDGRDTGIASGAGLGIEGSGTGAGAGDGRGYGPGGGRGRIVRAEWIERLPEYVIGEAFPLAARRSGIDGSALLICIVPKPGRPESCSVAEERPRGWGFGHAAMSLYPRFRIRPAMKGGEVYGARVLVGVTFTRAKTGFGR